MRFDFESMPPAARFEFLTGTVVPRPIALVTTVSPGCQINAAPYSFFNIMGIDPPVLALTVLPSPTGGMKDTGRNIRATKEFVVNLVSEALSEAMNLTCIDAPPEVDETKLANLTTTKSSHIAPPRLTAAPVAFECRLYRDIELSPNQFIAIGQIVAAHVDDKLVLDAAKFSSDTPGFKLIGAMHAARWYARTSDRFAMDRPTWAASGG